MRQKVGGQNSHAIAGDRQGSSDHVDQFLQMLVRSVLNAPRPNTSGSNERGKPSFTTQRFSRRTGPIVHKHHLQVCDDRARDLEMKALHRLTGLQFQPVTLADIGASGKADLTIDNQDLAMVPQVRVLEKTRRTGRQKARGGNTAASQLADHVGPAVSGTHAIDQYPHLNTPAVSRQQGVQERIAGTVVVEQVANQPYRALGVLYRLQHCWVGLVAIHQRLHEIPGGQWQLGQRVPDLG